MVAKQEDGRTKQYTYWIPQFKLHTVCPEGISHKEPEYSTFYDNCDQSLGDTGNFNEYFAPKIFYGRTNTLKFKLCHSYCKTCKNIGSYDYDQKCLTCLENYSYYNIFEISFSLNQISSSFLVKKK